MTPDNQKADTATIDTTALRAEWNHPEQYAEHEVIHRLLGALDASRDRKAWEIGLLRQVVATVPVGDQTVDFLHCVATACIETRPLSRPVGDGPS